MSDARVDRPKLKETYGELWDRYVAQAFPKLQEDSGGELTYPGEEWGNQESWQSIFNHLFVPSEVAKWKYAIEIGGGGGKYTERVLGANDDVRVWGFDVSRNFLESTARRLQQYVDTDRLSLNEIDSEHADAMMQIFKDAGLVRKVDAMFSIDAMVHVDLQYLVTYWINAAQVLKKGGRIVMTLADPTSEAGFQKIIRDIAKFYKFQGRMCPKFEYLSIPIVKHVLESLGFTMEKLEHWAQRQGAAPRDIYLIARLDRPEKADRFLSAIQSLSGDNDPIAGLGLSGAETYGEMWDRYATKLLASGDLDDTSNLNAVFKRLFEPSDVKTWSQAIEIGGADGKYAERVLAANSKVQLSRFDVSRKFLDAAEKRLSRFKDRVSSVEIDGTKPDAMFRHFERADLLRKVDALFSVDSMVHVDLQYITTYWLNAAQILREGGRIIMTLCDATSEAGFQKLIGDISKFFRHQGRACPRGEYQSANMVSSMLEKFGFEIELLEQWSPRKGEPARDLYLIARLKDAQRAERFRSAISTGLIPMLAKTDDPKMQGDDDVVASVSEERRNIARALGLAYWRRLLVQSNPDITKGQMQEQMKESWGGARREYTRLGLAVLKQLEGMGYSIKPDPGAAKARPNRTPAAVGD
jgi:cyclopropane fatty-acyl-phospholipid synthase-like methyltransferase